MANSSLYLTKHRFPQIRDPYKAKVPMDAIAAEAGSPRFKSPKPFRFNNKDTNERIENVLK